MRQPELEFGVPRKLGLFMASLDGGGAEQVMAALANGFAAEGHDVDFVLGRATGVFLSQLDSGVRVVDLGRHGALRSLPKLVRYLRRERPHAMLSALSHTNVVLLLAGLLARTKTRLIVSERTSFAGVTAYHRGVKDRLVRRLIGLTYRMADSIITVSEGLADELKRATGLAPGKIVSLNNPIVTKRLLQQACQEPDHPWMFDPEVPVILAVGRLAPEKDFKTLITAFALLREKRPARLVILGEGSERTALLRLAEEEAVLPDVALPGFRANPFAYMRRAKLFVLSSLFEGSPGALVQAMACGTPVVSTDCPTGPREILQDGRWGRLVPVADAEQLAAAMDISLSDRGRPEVVQRAMDFEYRSSVRRYLDVVLGTASGKPADGSCRDMSD